MADKRVYTIELNGIKESITAVDTLLAKLNDLQDRIKAISKNNSVKINLGTSDTKTDKDVEKAEESMKTLAGMRKELAKLKKELANTEVGTDAFEKLRVKVLDANNSVKSIEQSFGVFTRNVGNYTNSLVAAFTKFPATVQTTVNGLKSFNGQASTLGQQMRSVSKSMEELAANGEESSEAFEALKSVYGELAEKQRLFNDAIDDAKDNTNGLKDVTEIFSSIGGAMQVAAGAASMFGKNGDDAVKAIKKMQEIQNIAQGLKTFQQSLTKTGPLMKAWNASLTTSDKILKAFSISTKAEAAAQGTLASSTIVSANAMKVLRTAIASTGIGLLVVAIGSLVGYMMNLESETEKLHRQLGALGDFIEDDLSHKLEIISQKREIGEISNLDAAKQELDEYVEDTIDKINLLQKELKNAENGSFQQSLGFKYDGFDDDLGRKVEQFISTLKKGSKNIDEINAEIDRSNKLLKQLRESGDESLKPIIERIEAVRNALIEDTKALRNVQKESKQTAEDLKEATGEIESLQYSIKNYVESVDKSIRDFNTDAMADGFAKSKAKLDNSLQDQINSITRAAEEEKKQASGNSEAIQEIEKKKNEAIIAATKAHNANLQNLQSEWGRKRMNIESQIMKNELAAQKNNLDIRLKQLEIERQKEVQTAKESGIEIERQITAINAKYDYQEQEIRRNSQIQTENYFKQLRNQYLQTLMQIRNDNIEMSESLFDISAFESNFLNLENKFDGLIDYLKDVFIPKAKGSLENVQVDTNWVDEYKEKLRTEFNMTQEEIDTIMRNIAISMNSRINEALNEPYDDWDLVTYMRSDTEWIENNLKYLIQTYNENADVLKNSLRTTNETFAESIVGSINLVTQGLYDANMRFPELIDSQNIYWTKMEAQQKEHLNNLKEMRINAENQNFKNQQKFLQDEYEEQERQLKEKELSEEDYESAMFLINANYNSKLENLQEKHNLKLKQIENQNKQEISSINENHLNNLLSLYSNYFTEVQSDLIQHKRHMYNSWNIVNYTQIKKSLDKALNEYTIFCQKMEQEKKKLDEQLSNGEINMDTYTKSLKQIEDSVKNAQDAIEDITNDSKMLIGDLIGSINNYIQSVGQGVQQIMSLMFEKTNSELDKEMEYLENENDRISDLLDKQVEMVRNHNDKINDIEGQLGSARGDRRDQLIQAFNAEQQAREKSYAAQKKLEKEKERNEKKQRELEKKQNKERHKQQVAQAIVSAALATVNGLATQPFLYAGVAAGALAAALGAVQVGIISNTKYASGGQLDGGVAQGARHSQGGIKVLGGRAEIEGGEFITNRQTTRMNMPLLEFINEQKHRVNLNDLIEFYSDGKQHFKNGGVIKSRFADGGQIPTMNGFDIGGNQTRIVVDQNDQPIYVSVTEFEQVQGRMAKVKELAGY